MNQLQAARDTIALARSKGMDKQPYRLDLDASIQFPHLEDMLRRMESMTEKSDAKIGRWLGWMQCAVVVMTDATLDDMEEINIRNAADPEPAEVEYEYYTSSHPNYNDAIDFRNKRKFEENGWEVDESYVINGILVFDSHVERHWKRRKQS
ncbi:hypothetical protein EVB55_225 [Rhizobium phage RHph_Y68]|uniref:Uncharacterized protein n=1 Tax=Rhizobium phage RHph_Y68 TaxID=2509787 RepID=A0A7S5URS8_9CAUD|nr:hypothetical protein PP934_gp225 [Rhizobium phage RHph_Y68]QIG68160.1 hypothetical protein EVB55_225 [Rhizobium phage RHph_Y68]